MGDLRTSEENRVLALARKYARMKLMGRYVENGYLVIIDHHSRADMTKHYANELLRAAETLLVVMATDELDGELVE